MDLISKFKVIFQFVNCDSNSYSFEVKAKVDPGSLLFEIDPQHSNGNIFLFYLLYKKS